MSSFSIDITVSRTKSGDSKIRLTCCYCKKTFKNFESFRKHIEVLHKEELGIIQVKKYASRLCKLYKEAVR